METMFIPGPGGYEIPLDLYGPAQAKMAVLIVHGFGSSRESSAAVRLAQALAGQDMAACVPDLPGHGQSPADGRSLTVENCLADLAAAEACLRRRAPQARIAYFGSSFGAYLTSLYLARPGHRHSRAVLRCAALTMYRLLQEDMEREPALGRSLREQGEVLLREFDRPLLLTQGLMDSLQAHDPFRLCRPHMARLLLIHGTADEEAPVSQAREFARQMQAELVEIENAGHRFQGPGQMEQVIETALAFLCPTGWERAVTADEQ